jgi:hypothetical protein
VNKGRSRALMWRCEAVAWPNAVSIDALNIYEFGIHL